MCNITVTRYPIPTAAERAEVGPDVGFPSDNWQGVIEPDDKSWIAFIATDGSPTFFLDRDPTTGAVK